MYLVSWNSLTVVKNFRIVKRWFSSANKTHSTGAGVDSDSEISLCGNFIDQLKKWQTTCEPCNRWGVLLPPTSSSSSTTSFLFLQLQFLNEYFMHFDTLLLLICCLLCSYYLLVQVAQFCYPTWAILLHQVSRKTTLMSFFSLVLWCGPLKLFTLHEYAQYVLSVGMIIMIISP